jgi:hypothetical protein
MHGGTTAETDEQSCGGGRETAHRRVWQNSNVKMCAIQNSAPKLVTAKLCCPMTDRAKFRKLILRIERDLLAQAHLRALLTAANDTLADRRREMRNLKARIERSQ